MKRTCLQVNTREDQRMLIGNQCSEAKLNTYGQNSYEFHPVEILLNEHHFEPKDNQFVKSFVRMKRNILLAVTFLLATSVFSQMLIVDQVPVELSQGHVKQITNFGERCDWSHDGKHLIFLEKSFGDVYEVEVATGKLRPLTHHFFHQGYLRALYLANGDYLLVGARKFDPQNAWESRSPKNAEMWILKKDLQSPPTPLGVFCKEGPTCSRKQMKIAWTIDDIFMADVVYENGIPKLSTIDTLVRSADLPGEVNNWHLETQNFRPPYDNELIFNAHFPKVEYEAEVMGIDLKTRKIVNYSHRADRYDEPEGIFPDGKSTLVESTRHFPKRQPGHTTWDYIDLYKLALDGSGNMERLTFFNEGLKFRATNPVVSDDGKFMAFQYCLVGETTGIGHGILIWDFEKAEKAKKKLIKQGKQINYSNNYD